MNPYLWPFAAPAAGNQSLLGPQPKPISSSVPKGFLDPGDPRSGFERGVDAWNAASMRTPEQILEIVQTTGRPPGDSFIADALGMLPNMAASAYRWYQGRPRTSMAEGYEDYILPAAALMPAARKGLPVAKAAGSVARKIPKALPKQVMSKLPDIRRMSIPDATAQAATEQHLVPSTAGKGFVGGPPSVKNRKDLEGMRDKFDARVKENMDGWGWYKRYKQGTREVTGGDPRDADWVSSQQAMFSQGVSPQSEIQYATKENNALLMGHDAKSMYSQQANKHKTAAQTGDINAFELGDKTGEYGHKVNPNTTRATAVGTNDFRHAREWGYDVGSGTAKTSLSVPEHRFVDYETALAVKRANDQKWGGRSDWTGENLQEVPWVTQKAKDIVVKRGMVASKMKNNPKMTEREAFDEAFSEAMVEANSVPKDYFDKHTAFATHEAQPGETTGHLPLSVDATNAERAAFAADPRSDWAFAPGGRDAIYSGLRLGDTGIAARVRPTTPMLGSFQDKMNPGAVARPLVSFEQGKGSTKSIREPDRQMLEAGESLRAAIDAQDMGGAHKVWAGGRAGDSKGVYIPLPEGVQPQTMRGLLDAGGRHGVGDVVDTGQGVTFTNFDGSPAASTNKFNPRGLLDELTGVTSDVGPRKPLLPRAEGYQVKVDAVSEGLWDKWSKGEGSGAVTRHVLDRINVTPEARAAFDNNPHLAKAALDRIQRDKDWSKKWGVQRKDIETFRRIVSKGAGWVSRLEKELKKNPGTLPAIGLAVVGGAAYGDE